MGYGNSQYLVVAHGRNDPGHDEPHNHDHIHIVANSVDLDGKFINDRLNYPRLEKILRQIEKDEKLTQIKSSWEVKKRAPTHGQTQRYKRERREVAAGERETATLPVSDRLQMAIDLAAKESSSVVDFAQTLAERGIGTKLKITRTGLVRGISYSLDEVSYQGNQLYDASLPKLQSVRGLSFDPKTDPNRFRKISPNPHPQPIILSEDRGSNFPQNIPGSHPRDGSPLPEFLQMLEKAENEIAQDFDGEGDSLDVLDVNDKKNLKILEDVAKIENEVAQVDRANETPKQQPHKIKPRSRSHEIG